jgi:subtilisin family serine protease
MAQEAAASEVTDTAGVEMDDVITTDDAAAVAEFITENTYTDLDKYDADSYYALKRIMVLTDGNELDSTYGAMEAIYYEDYNEYVLQFETEADTEYAYYRLAEEYGEDNCFVDQIITTDILEDVGDIVEHSSYSWGGSYMGLSYLKSEYDYYQIDNDVTVAIIDTGVDTSSSVFDGRIDTANSYYFYGSSTVTKNRKYEDENGHGTHVAGIIADNTPDNVYLMILRTFDSEGKSTNVAMRTALQYAVDNGADVINMSLGWTGILWAKSTLLEDVIAEAEAKGVIICCAAGNSAANVKYTYPANQTKVISVSAINSNGSFAASYSNYGSTIDYCAPGTSIISTYLGGKRKTLSGTSMSTPHVVAAVAYVKMLNPNAGLSSVNAILRQYSVDLGSAGWDQYYGYGCINLRSYFDNADLSLRYGNYNSDGTLKAEPAAAFSKTAVTKTYGNGAFSNLVNTASTGKVKYTSSDKSVATVDNYGRVTIKGAGICTIGATIAADANYKSTYITYQLTVNPKDISKVKITLSKTSYIYSGKKCKPTVTVKGLEDSEYSVSYKNSNAVGTATVVVKGYGNYTGTCNISYTIKPAKVTISTIKNTSEGIKLTWKKVSGNPGYSIYRKTATGSWTKIASIAAGKKTSYTDKKAVAGKKYFYRIRAVSGKVSGAYSTSVSQVRVKTTAIKLSSVSSGVKVKWNKVSKVSGYQIQYATSSSFKNAEKVTVKGASTRSYRLEGLSRSKKYYVRVRAYKTVNGKKYYSAWSSSMSCTTK